LVGRIVDGPHDFVPLTVPRHEHLSHRMKDLPIPADDLRTDARAGLLSREEDDAGEDQQSASHGV
jgi:hypothetical protein